MFQARRTQSFGQAASSAHNMVVCANDRVYQLLMPSASNGALPSGGFSPTLDKCSSSCSSSSSSCDSICEAAVILNDKGHQLAPLLPKKVDSPFHKAAAGSPGSVRPWLHHLKVAAVLLWNCGSTIGIVAANKLVYSAHGFNFPIALSWLHVIFTALGMYLMAALGVVAPREVPLWDQLLVAAGFVGYVVFGNLSLQMNTVGFYQLMKIGITPTVVVLQWLGWRQRTSPRTLAAVTLLVAGIILATLADKAVSTRVAGALVGVTSTCVAALYQIWTGKKQQALHVNGNELLYAVSPVAAGLLTLMVPLLEPMGFEGLLDDPPAVTSDTSATLVTPPTLLDYKFTWASSCTILLSCLLGLSVTLSSYWAIGLTSPLTFNVVGHLKTGAILTMGILVFGDALSPAKGCGLVLAFAGIAWYSWRPAGRG